MLSFLDSRRLNSSRFQAGALGFLLLAVFLVYWLYSRQFYGPAYLCDEIGYLSKAAVFAGYAVDMATSWQGGYSLMLAPLFRIFSDPYMLWQAILALNALMFSASFFMLFCFLRGLFPEKSFWQLMAAVALSACYPAWITMSGYAFATPGFVLIFMAALLALQKAEGGKGWSLWLHSLFVGFLYWLHPVGLAVVVASALAVLVMVWPKRLFWLWGLHVVALLGLVGAYKFGVHPWVNTVMTPEGYTALGHYPDTSFVLEKLLSPDFWKSWPVIILGQSSYLFIASFGVVALAMAEVWQRRDEAAGFAVLSVFGIVALGSLAVATSYANGQWISINHWMYGRYSEMALLPLLGIGFLAVWRHRNFLYTAVFVLIAGVIVNGFSDGHTNTYNNLVMIPSLWPVAFAVHGSYFQWGLIGAVGIAVIGLRKKWFVILAIPVFMMCLYLQNYWHSDILADYSKPRLDGVVRTNFEIGETIGFDPYLPEEATLLHEERYYLYSYYFFNYNYRRMSPEEWLSTAEGPYLTYRPEIFSEYSEVKVIAREDNSGLYLLMLTKP